MAKVLPPQSQEFKDLSAYTHWVLLQLCNHALGVAPAVQPPS